MLFSMSFSASIRWIEKLSSYPPKNFYVLEPYSNERLLNLDMFLIIFSNTIPTVGLDVTKVSAIS